MKLAAVYACIYVISSNIAQMPLHVMRKTNNKVEAARDHPVFYLVHDEPNMWQTSYKWRELKQRHILGWGNGYTWVKRSRRGEVSGLTNTSRANTLSVSADSLVIGVAGFSSGSLRKRASSSIIPPHCR